MPPRQKVLTLPDEIRGQLNSRLIGSAFGDYNALSAWLREQGYEISKSALQVYGKQLERKIEAIRIATEQAKALAEAIPDDENTMLDAAYRLAQEQIYQVLLNVEIDPDEPVTLDKLSRMVRALTELGGGSVRLKKYQQEVKERLALAEERIAGIARTGGLSEDAIRQIELELGAIG